MKIIYVGNMEKIAEFIFFKEQMELDGIICENDRLSDELYTYSIVRRVPLYPIANAEDLVTVVRRLGMGYVYVMCSYGRRVPIEMMRGYSWYNIHYAELPKYKGRHPTYWATVSGEKYVGISLHKVTERFDEGKIIAQEKVEYYFWENETELFEKLTQCVPKLLNDLAASDRRGALMENNSGNYYMPVSREELVLDLSQDEPDIIYNKVRSQSRANGVLIQAGEKVFRIFQLFFSRRDCKEPYEIVGKSLYIKYREGMTIITDNYLVEI